MQGGNGILCSSKTSKNVHLVKTRVGHYMIEYGVCIVKSKQCTILKSPCNEMCSLLPSPSLQWRCFPFFTIEHLKERKR